MISLRTILINVTIFIFADVISSYYNSLYPKYFSNGLMPMRMQVGETNSVTVRSENGKSAGTQPQVFVCTNRWCREKGSDATMATFSFLCPKNIAVNSVNCLGRCNKGPNARILTSGKRIFSLNVYIPSSIVCLFFIRIKLI
jgi:hypothetical protein